MGILQTSLYIAAISVASQYRSEVSDPVAQEVGANLFSHVPLLQNCPERMSKRVRTETSSVIPAAIKTGLNNLQ